MKYKILLFCCFFFVSAAIAQKEGNIWYFGNKAGLDFNSGAPVVLNNSSLRAFEGSASIADKDGKLLFYTDGITVWNQLHKVMENGTGLLGDSSSTQSGIIVPHPGNQFLYYIFTVDNVGGPDGLRYSIADMGKNNHLGAVTSKNNLLVTPVTEKITAVKHSNNIDIWIIAHAWNSDAFYAYLLTESGLVNQNEPIVSHVGTVHSGSPTNAIGYLKASPDGSKLALGIRQMNTYELFNFDNTSGIVSNVTTFKSVKYNSPYGVEFSPDGSKLYFNATLSPTAKIYQVDLTNNNTVALIGTSSSPYAGALQLAPDGKIYFARYENITVGGSKYLGVIEHPDKAGAACVYTDDGLYLQDKTSLFGLPTFVQSYWYKPFFTFSQTCLREPVSFHLADEAGILQVEWQLGNAAKSLQPMAAIANPSVAFTDPGTYEVAVQVWYADGSIRKSAQTIYIPPTTTVDLGKDTILCPGQELLLDAFLEGASYAWQDGSAQASLTVKQAGVYWVDVTLNGCTTRDSIQVDYREQPLIDLGSDTTLCQGNTLELVLAQLNHAIDFRWQDGSTGNTFTVTETGTYWVDVVTPCGKIRDSIQVTYTSPPLLHFPEKTVYDPKQALLLNAVQPSPETTYYWQDGSTKASLSVEAPGVYWVEVSNPCGTTIDSVIVAKPVCEVGDVPNVITPNGDGVNDAFIFPCIQDRDWQLLIYNRWGKLVYENKAYKGQWQADNMSNGAYYYCLTSKTSEKLIKGIIHVLR